jgi:hypothetical protein
LSFIKSKTKKRKEEEDFPFLLDVIIIDDFLCSELTRLCHACHGLSQQSMRVESIEEMIHDLVVEIEVLQSFYLYVRLDHRVRFYEK